MSTPKSEYEVEEIFINQLTGQGYSYIEMSNYDDVLANFREQFCKVNAAALIEVKGKAELSDSEFEKILLRLDNHTIYESAKILREKWVLELDNGKTIYAEFLTSDMDRNTYQVTHQITMDKAPKHSNCDTDLFIFILEDEYYCFCELIKSKDYNIFYDTFVNYMLNSPFKVVYLCVWDFEIQSYNTENPVLIKMETMSVMTLDISRM